jgi:hypothetical protein
MINAAGPPPSPTGPDRLTGQTFRQWKCREPVVLNQEAPCAPNRLLIIELGCAVTNTQVVPNSLASRCIRPSRCPDPVSHR